MKQIILILMIGIMIPTGLNAQKVYKEGTKVVLDMTVAAGMPAGAVTNVSKTDIYNQATLVDNYTWLFAPQSGYTTMNLHNYNGSICSTVFQKLEVAPTDANKVDAPSTFTMTWIDALKACQSYTNEGDGWRLPTMRELQMICIFRDALEPLGIVFSTPPSYWSATEDSASYALYVSLSGLSEGSMSHINKIASFRVRCVREITN